LNASTKESAMNARARLAFAAFLLCAGVAAAGDDKFARCPDPAAARQYVQDCLQQNPYNTQEVCEARALEKLCPGVKQ
jgi:hypothetical protein